MQKKSCIPTTESARGDFLLRIKSRKVINTNLTYNEIISNNLEMRERAVLLKSQTSMTPEHGDDKVWADSGDGGLAGEAIGAESCAIAGVYGDSSCGDDNHNNFHAHRPNETKISESPLRARLIWVECV